MIANKFARKKYSGVTLIELAVAVAILGVVIALLLPAIQSAREAARRAQCSKNLSQMTIASLAYESAARTLPMGTNYKSFSVHTSILPFMEQTNLYNAINFSFNSVVIPRQNQTAGASVPSVFLCPSDYHPSGFSGCTNYAGNTGGGLQKYGRNGAFVASDHRPPAIAEFIDGASNTSMFSEFQVSNPGSAKRDPLRVIFTTPVQLTDSSQFDSFAESCRGLDIEKANLNHARKGRNWLFGDLGWTLYNHVLTPLGNTCTNGTAVQHGAWTSGSGHPGGVNVAFVDGHTRFIPKFVDLQVWRALASRNGNESIPLRY